MLNKPSTSGSRALGLLLAVCFTASLFICGDADCSGSNNDKDCTCLLCAVLHNHGASSPDSFSGTNKDCSCVCHVPTIVASTFSFDYHPISRDNIFIVIASVPLAPNRIVYHPPATPFLPISFMALPSSPVAISLGAKPSRNLWLNLPSASKC